jgi:glycosyltransferase involved in cell wall biosynthesis
MEISVIICTHNPREDHLRRTLDGLRKQTLPQDCWELLVIDNRSTAPLADRLDLAWHPAARVVREDELGLTPARLRGLTEARSDLVLYVDDDNVLAPDYLDQAVRIGREWPMLGAWGAGVLEPEFEVPPPEWTAPYHWYLAVHRIERDRWSNLPDQNVFPPGAGMVLRKAAALECFREILGNPLRRSLDRRGDSLSSCGDGDLVWTMTEKGWGAGRFVCLKLVHLMAARRLEESYLERLITGMWSSNVLLKYIHGIRENASPGGWRQRLSQWRYLRSLSPRNRWEHDAVAKGHAQARAIIAEMEGGRSQGRPTA